MSSEPKRTFSLNSSSSVRSRCVLSPRTPSCGSSITCSDLNLPSSLFLAERARINLVKEGLTCGGLLAWGYSWSILVGLRVAAKVGLDYSRKVEEESSLLKVSCVVFSRASGVYCEMKLDLMLKPCR